MAELWRWHRSKDVRGRDRRDPKVAEGVLDHRQSRCLAHRHRVAERDQASQLVGVGDDHVGGALGDHVGHLGGQPDRLVGGDPHPRLRPQVGEAADVVHVDRLLDELDADLLESLQTLPGLEYRPALVRVDAEGDLIAHLLLDRTRDREVVVEVETDLDVDRPEPPTHALGRLRARRFRVAVVDVDEPVERHVRRLQPAEELIHGAAVVLAGDVPEGHLDPGRGRVAEVGVVVPTAVLTPGEELGDPQRVLADDPGRGRLERIAHERDQGTARDLADPGDPLVGVDLDDRVGQAPEPTKAPRLGLRERHRDDVDIDVRDLHGAPIIRVTYDIIHGRECHTTCYDPR